MAISSIGSSNILAQSVQSQKALFDTLNTQLTTGKKSTTYAGMGVNEGFAIAARGQIANYDAYADTMTKVGTAISVANTAMSSFTSIAKSVQTAAASVSQTLGTNGQSQAQQVAVAQFQSMIGVLNTQAGDRYVFSGSSITTAPTASASAILDGDGSRAGVKQYIAERRVADQGANGLGRLTITQPTTTSVAVAEDVANGVFGMKVSGVTSTLGGAAVSGPAGSPSALAIDFTSNPSEGDTVSLTLRMPDYSTETLTLKATTTSPAGKNAFTIGTTPAATAANLQAAVTDSISLLSKTTLVSSSAVQASCDFFEDPPIRVLGSPATATDYVRATDADTVIWYTGENGAGSARSTAVARVDDAVSVQYGARANEKAFVKQLRLVAAFAAVTTSSSDPNAVAQVSNLSNRISNGLNLKYGQTLSDVQSDFSVAQTIMDSAKSRQKAYVPTLQGVIDQAEAVSPNEVATQLLALQTSLQASYQTTAMLSQLTLTKFL